MVGWLGGGHVGNPQGCPHAHGQAIGGPGGRAPLRSGAVVNWAEPVGGQGAAARLCLARPRATPVVHGGTGSGRVLRTE